MKILFCAYRQWAKNIYNNLNKDYDLELCESQSDLHNLNPKNYRMVLFVGWSDIVNSNWTDNVECICVHPSELPKYRGGSPIQNQIIAGEKWSAISLFKMNDKIDCGDIVAQTKFSLSGSLDNVFNRIEKLSTSMIEDILSNPFCNTYTKQDESSATHCKRRTPDMSEIKMQDFANCTAEELYNKIRCLQHPYPLPYVECKNNTKLYLTGASI